LNTDKCVTAKRKTPLQFADGVTPECPECGFAIKPRVATAVPPVRRILFGILAVLIFALSLGGITMMGSLGAWGLLLIPLVWLGFNFAKAAWEESEL
jgi:hypothetical protein